MRLVSVQEYDDCNREGTSIYVRALRLGSERWHVEIGRSWIYVALGAVAFSAGFEWPDVE